MAKGKRKLRAKNSTSIEKLLSNNEVKQYEAGGYVLEEMHNGGEGPGHPHEGDPPDKKPLFVIDENDPRLQGFQDSLSLYNQGAKDRLTWQTYSSRAASGPYWRKTVEEELPEGYVVPNQKIQPTGRKITRAAFPKWMYPDGSGKGGSELYKSTQDTYAKPQQPVFVGDETNTNYIKYIQNEENAARKQKIVNKQQQLIDAGFKIGKADGVWGSKSKAAWAKFVNKEDVLNLPISTIPAYSIDEVEDIPEEVEEEPEIEIERLPIITPTLKTDNNLEIIGDYDEPEELERPDYSNYEGLEHVKDRFRKGHYKDRQRVSAKIAQALTGYDAEKMDAEIEAADKEGRRINFENIGLGAVSNKKFRKKYNKEYDVYEEALKEQKYLNTVPRFFKDGGPYIGAVPKYALGGAYGPGDGSHSIFELTDNEVKQYEAGGYVLKELKEGGEDDLITYKNNKSKVDGTADWNWSSDVEVSSAYNDQIKARLLTGNYGYNPKTGTLVKLSKSKQTKVTDKDTLDTKKTLKETAGMSSKEYEIFQDNEKEAAKQNAMSDYTANKKLVSIDKADEWNPSFTIQNESGQNINTQDYAGKQVYMTDAEEAAYKKTRINKNIPVTTKKMNNAFATAAAFTPAGMAITGLTGATKLVTESAPELIKNPSWSNAGAAGIDLLTASPLVIPAGISAARNLKGVGEKVDKIVWPKTAYRVKTASGKKNLDYSAGQKVSAKEKELLAKVEKQGEWYTDDIDEVAQYAKGNDTRAGVFQGDDMVIDKVKIPFWAKNKNVTTNKNVVALKKEQGFVTDGSPGSIGTQRINPNEFIIPKKSIFYPKTSTTIKSMPEHIAKKPAMYTLGDGKTKVDVSNTFKKSYDYMQPPKGNETYLTKPYQYLDEQVEAATGINPKIFEGVDDVVNVSKKANIPAIKNNDSLTKLLKPVTKFVKPLVKKAITKVDDVYNKVATGNSRLPVAWKMEKNANQIPKLVKNKYKLTDEEAEVLGKYINSPYNLERGTAESKLFDDLIQRNSAILDDVKVPVTKILNHSTQTGKDVVPNAFNSKFKFRGNRSWTLGTDGTRMANTNRTRLVVPSKYSKDLNFTKVDYADERILKGWNNSTMNNSSTHPALKNLDNVASENELLGNVPKGYKVIGRNTEGGYNNTFIKPIKQEGGTVRNLSKTQAENYKTNGYILEEY
tara:strand:- start:1333 stop:4875 length:3543 start_codon:yes stop_codon:yes gene_type:complete